MRRSTNCSFTALAMYKMLFNLVFCLFLHKAVLGGLLVHASAIAQTYAPGPVTYPFIRLGSDLT